MVKKLVSVWLNWNKTKHMPSITNFLVTNPMFRRLALGYHEAKEDVKGDASSWLEKELLTKEQYDALYPKTRLNNKDGNTTTGNKWTNK